MRSIYACDIGSTLPNSSNFAWIRCVPDENEIPHGNSDIESLIKYLAEDLQKGWSVAIGFESPLFLPVPNAARELSKGRKGESDRSWAAQPGGYVTALGIHQAAWILREIFQVAGNSHRYSSDWNLWPPSEQTKLLFCWEAFVSGQSHSNDHLSDAATAVTCFLANELQLENANAIKAYLRISLIHAIALWSGWAKDINGLHDAVLVIKPNNQYRGKIITV